MNQLLRHNPFALPEAPDFVNDIGVKWWGVDIGEPADGTAVYVEDPSGDTDYLILRDGEIIYGTRSLDQLAWHFTVLERLRRDEEVTQ